MLQRYPDTLRWRQAMPPLFVISLIGLLIASIFWQAAGWLLAVVIFVYLLVLFLASLPAAIKRRDVRMLIGVPAAIAVMHLCWGSGFIGSIIHQIFGMEKIA